MTQQNRQWTLSRRPQGDIGDGDLVLETGPVPTAGKGQIVVRSEWLSLDPTNRIWMSDMDQYMEPVQVGDAMRGFVVGRVVDSQSDLHPKGAYVMGVGSWSEYCCASGGSFFPLFDLPGVSPKDMLGQYYHIGPTAYFGLLDIGSPKIGETLVVSAAAGAVGSLAVQFGKAWGCRVIGIAGGKEKCDWIAKDLGCDAVIDYKSENVAARLDALCPKGIDIFFDNVGGDILDATMARMNLFGRVIQCGMIAVYTTDGKGAAPASYPRILMKRLRVQGFIVLDYLHRYPEALRAMAVLHAAGKLRWRYHDVIGIEKAGAAVRMLYNGKNNGKLMVKIADPI